MKKIKQNMNNFQKKLVNWPKSIVTQICILNFIGLIATVSVLYTLLFLCFIFINYETHFLKWTTVLLTKIEVVRAVFDSWFTPFIFACTICLVLINWVLKIIKQKICVFICFLMLFRLINWQEKHLTGCALKIDFLQYLESFWPKVSEVLLGVEFFISNNQFWCITLISLVFLILTRQGVIVNLGTFLSTSVKGTIFIVIAMNAWVIFFLVSSMEFFFTANRFILISLGIVASVLTWIYISDYVICIKIAHTNKFKIMKIAFLGQSEKLTMKEKKSIKDSVTFNDRVFSLTVLLVWLLVFGNFCLELVFEQRYNSLRTNFRLLKFNVKFSLATSVKAAGNYLQGRTPTIEAAVLRGVLKQCHGKKLLAVIFYGTTKPLLANILKESGVKLMPKMLMLPGGGIVTLSRKTQDGAYLLPETFQKLAETINGIDSNNLSLANKKTKEVLIRGLIPKTAYAMNISKGHVLNWRIRWPKMNLNFTPQFIRSSTCWRNTDNQKLLIKQENNEKIKVNSYDFDSNILITKGTVDRESKQLIAIDGQLCKYLDFYRNSDQNTSHSYKIKAHPYLELWFHKSEHTHNYAISTSFETRYYREKFASSFLEVFQHADNIILIANTSPITGERDASAINMRSIILHKDLSIFKLCNNTEISREFIAAAEETINNLLFNASKNQIIAYNELGNLYNEKKISSDVFIQFLIREFDLGYLDIKKPFVQEDNLSNTQLTKSCLLEQPKIAIKITNTIPPSPIYICPALKQYTDSLAAREIIITKNIK